MKKHTDLTPLRDWCAANDIPFNRAKGYRHRHSLTIEQTVAYYQSDRETLSSMCRRLGVSLGAAESYKYRTGCTKKEAVDHCLMLATMYDDDKPRTAAQKAAQRYGVDIKRLYHVMSKKHVSADRAARSLAAKDRGQAVHAAPKINPILTRAWV